MVTGSIVMVVVMLMVLNIGTAKRVTLAMFSTTSDTRLMRRVASGSTLQVLWIVLIS